MRTLLCLALVACGNSGNDPMNSGDDAPSPDAMQQQTPPVTPRAGAWDYDQVTPVSNTCPGNLQQTGTGAFAIDQSSTASFHVVPNDGTAPFTCNLTGSAYNCPDRAAGMQDLRPAIDAVVTVRAIANGTFSSATRASGRQEATATCAGTQCAATGATFPCNVKVDYVIQAR